MKSQVCNHAQLRLLLVLWIIQFFHCTINASLIILSGTFAKLFLLT